MRTAERLFARAVRLLPREFAAEYGADMVRTFARRAADRRSRGGISLLLFTLREVAGVAAIVILERAERLRAIPARSAPHRDLLSRLEHMLTELRHAGRRLLRTPGFTCAAVLTLALAIGANTAIFTLLNRVVLSPLPYGDADRLIAVDHTAPGVGLITGVGISSGLYREYGELPSIEAIAIHVVTETTLSGDGAARRLSSLYTTPTLTDVLAVEPALGRWFTAEEGTP